MTELEQRMYLALQGARTIIAATANVNPAALRIKTLVDSVISEYQRQKEAEVEHAD